MLQVFVKKKEEKKERRKNKRKEETEVYEGEKWKNRKIKQGKSWKEKRKLERNYRKIGHWLCNLTLFGPPKIFQMFKKKETKGEKNIKERKKEKRSNETNKKVITEIEQKERNNQK